MKGTLELVFEDKDGRPVGKTPRWRAHDRGFLWDFVHDTRGVLRRSVRAAYLDRIRRVEPPGRDGDPAFRMEPGEALQAYEAGAAAIEALGEDGPCFHWVAPVDSEAWAAVHHWEDDDQRYSLVGGWSSPSLRGGPDGTEPLRTIPADQDQVAVGATVVRIRRESLRERFGDDVDAVIAALREAVAEGHFVRFRQR